MRAYAPAIDSRHDASPISDKALTPKAVASKISRARNAGWTRDEWRDGQGWSAGAGLVTSSGVALDLAYRQAIGGGSNRVLAAGIKLFLFN